MDVIGAPLSRKEQHDHKDSLCSSSGCLNCFNPLPQGVTSCSASVLSPLVLSLPPLLVCHPKGEVHILPFLVGKPGSSSSNVINLQFRRRSQHHANVPHVDTHQDVDRV